MSTEKIIIIDAERVAAEVVTDSADALAAWLDGRGIENYRYVRDGEFDDWRYQHRTTA